MSAVSGLLPRCGETVLVSPSAGAHITSTYWMRVADIRPSNQPGWIYLYGEPVESPAKAHTLFVRIEGLVIRR